MHRFGHVSVTPGHRPRCLQTSASNSGALRLGCNVQRRRVPLGPHAMSSGMQSWTASFGNPKEVARMQSRQPLTSRALTRDTILVGSGSHS